MFSHVTGSIDAKCDGPNPLTECKARRYGNKYEPEPEKDVDFLDEQVERQHAHDGVRVDGAHLTYLEAAESDAREAFGLRPINFV